MLAYGLVHQARDDTMQNENIWKLLARKMTGEATEEELKELQLTLKNDPVMNYTAETFVRLWNALSSQQTQENNSAMGTCEDG
ncbi:MAG TPA: hypothetical protein VJU78_17990 [Chitinophagaceae bacterium]|nr:hypothetical protein [Chitinophagaceae bacterium]